MAQVKIIAPQTREAEHLRVAAYCRVSSDSKDQLHSYAAQIRSYTEEIAQHDAITYLWRLSMPTKGSPAPGWIGGRTSTG